jgi:hypothetical protein
MNIMRFIPLSLLLFPFFLLAEEKVDFNTQIKSILSNKCIACHGPDEEHREAGLRLDTFDGATEDLGGYAALIPGNAEDSEMIFRMGLDPDDEEIMPPRAGEIRLPKRKSNCLADGSIREGSMISTGPTKSQFAQRHLLARILWTILFRND